MSGEAPPPVPPGPPTPREQVLAAVRAALADVGGGEPAAWDPAAEPDPAAAYWRTGPPGDPGPIERFIARCGDYRATVIRCAPGEIPAAVAAACARHGARTLAIAPDLDPAWIPESIAVRHDAPPLTLIELDRCDGALTACALAIAETGTIALDGGLGQGRRALTLVPDLHLCVVDATAIVASVPEAIARLRTAVTERGAPITLISGPSATSDIELERVEGVHGPRRLEVIVAG
jgi:L-lactate dehydrogenase complex protein LldG